MKSALSSACTACTFILIGSLPALAADTISLGAGSSATVNAGVETTVSCQGTVEAPLPNCMPQFQVDPRNGDHWDVIIGDKLEGGQFNTSAAAVYEIGQLRSAGVCR